jgi:hypothetical protein
VAKKGKMLEQLLNEIRSGGTLEANQLAVKLGTTPKMIEALLEHLQRAGHIRAYTTCADGCAGCGLKDGCNVPQKAESLRLWQSG